MPRQKFSVYIDRSSESALKLWILCLQFIVSVQFVTQISGMLIKSYTSETSQAVGKDSSKTNRVENSITL